MTFYQLMNALKTGLPINLASGQGIFKFAIVTGVASEDGSGHCWNVTFCNPNHQRKTVFVRTID